MNKASEAAFKVLHEAGAPLHYREITQRAIAAKYFVTEGKTPEATINAQISVDIQRRGLSSRFCRTGPGTFALRGGTEQGVPIGPRKIISPKSKALSFPDAAEKVMQRFGNREPMHYRDITAKARELDLIVTTGRTPEATMYAQIIQECQRRERRGQPLRFDRRGKGMIGLYSWLPKGLAAEIEVHNRHVREALHKRLRSMEPAGFEELIGQLLGEIGFAEVEVTQRHGDGGIDVRGTLVVGEVIRTKMAVQFKRWKQNVQTPTVREVRGSLGAHEQGLIITTSAFGKNAIEEAQRADAIPIGLMDGTTLVGLLVEYEIGIKRAPHELLAISDMQP